MKEITARPTQALEESEIGHRIKWLINLRWIAIAGTIFAIIFVYYVFHVDLPIVQLLFTVFILLLCNLCFFAFDRLFFIRSLESKGIRSADNFAKVQIFTDLILLTLLIHFSGGIENPFFFYYIFHIIIASILLSIRATYWTATMAVLLFSVNVLLEYLKIIPHYRIEKITLVALHDNIFYCGGALFAFATTVYLSVYMATSITGRLRKRHKEIIYLKDELEKRNTQLQETQASLIQAEKMISLGQIAAAVAHEINNPLSGVLVYIRVLQKNLEEQNVDPAKFTDRLNLMEKEIDRSSRIIKNLLDFSHHGKPQLRPCDLEKKIDDALIILVNQANLNNVRIIKKFNNVPEVFADPDHMRQVFVNIILNAIQAMPDGGTLVIGTEYMKEDNTVAISFQDTGCGIKKEHMANLFTPFFTTKGKEKGVGLGLAVCYNIINRHNGRILAESEEGRGATFTVILKAQRNRGIAS